MLRARSHERRQLYHDRWRGYLSLWRDGQRSGFHRKRSPRRPASHSRDQAAARAPKRSAALEFKLTHHPPTGLWVLWAWLGFHLPLALRVAHVVDSNYAVSSWVPGHGQLGQTFHKIPWGLDVDYVIATNVWRVSASTEDNDRMVFEPGHLGACASRTTEHGAQYIGRRRSAPCLAGKERFSACIGTRREPLGND